MTKAKKIVVSEMMRELITETMGFAPSYKDIVIDGFTDDFNAVNAHIGNRAYIYEDLPSRGRRLRAVDGDNVYFDVTM
jgi:hypothetical protein